MSIEKLNMFCNVSTCLSLFQYVQPVSKQLETNYSQHLSSNHSPAHSLNANANKLLFPIAVNHYLGRHPATTSTAVILLCWNLDNSLWLNQSRFFFLLVCKTRTNKPYDSCSCPDNTLILILKSRSSHQYDNHPKNPSLSFFGIHVISNRCFCFVG